MWVLKLKFLDYITSLIGVRSSNYLGRFIGLLLSRILARRKVYLHIDGLFHRLELDGVTMMYILVTYIDGWVVYLAGIMSYGITTCYESFGITRLRCVSYGITRLMCVSDGITKLMCVSNRITRLICVSDGITGMICASYVITRLMCTIIKPKLELSTQEKAFMESRIRWDDNMEMEDDESIPDINNSQPILGSCNEQPIVGAIRIISTTVTTKETKSNSG
ncbi:mucin-19-like isoform X12 [Cucumis melo var. makuwa]|uniref:Mucin-19-like isoform X12 n=1 Tax=Cucumis melo var. makuwa TaxID=1194695 RepID=A0A5D3CTY8_CUCMM|nr:mucin-19-like isoform X12 [Cucumis melo var. makuwa]